MAATIFLVLTPPINMTSLKLHCQPICVKKSTIKTQLQHFIFPKKICSKNVEIRLQKRKKKPNLKLVKVGSCHPSVTRTADDDAI